MGKKKVQPTRESDGKEYPVTIERLGDLEIVNHSALFQLVEPIKRKLDQAKGSESATFNYQPGSRRRVKYSVGKVSLMASVTDAISQGSPDPHFEIWWDTRYRPLQYLDVALRTIAKVPGHRCEVVDWPRNSNEGFGGIDFIPLNRGTVTRLQRDGDPTLQRINSGNFSVLAQDVNGKRGNDKPEIFVIGGLGDTAVTRAVDVTLCSTVHPDMLPYLDVIRSREPEIFPHFGTDLPVGA